MANLLHGTTAVADGFYGHAILSGTRSVRFFLDELKTTPVKPLFVVPILCYTANRFLGIPAAPNAPTVDDLYEMLEWEETIGVEETGYELLLEPERRDVELLAFFEAALRKRAVISGHGAGLPSDRAVNGFLAAGVTNNHELVAQQEARRQAELGLVALIREGASCRDTEAVARAVTQDGLDPRAFLLCPDVVATEEMFEVGQQDHCVRVAIANGIEPMRAIQMSTIQPAEHLRVSHDVGMIAAGRYADIVFVDDLAAFSIRRVIANGEVWVEEGRLRSEGSLPHYPSWLYETMQARPVAAEDFRVEAGRESGTVQARVIVVRDGSLESEEAIEPLPVRDGLVQADPARGIDKIAMIDRVLGTGEIGVGFVKGFGLKEGAIGTSANVFNQNVVVVGATDEDLAAAANAIVALRGGFVGVRAGRVEADFPTPLNGIVSDLGFRESRQRIGRLLEVWRSLGCGLATPQTSLEFVTLVTIPRLRISTKGLALFEGDGYRFVETVVA
jgi:adenine deaminase